MKKILLIDNASWSIFNFRLPIIRHLRSSGYQVAVAVPLDEYTSLLNPTDFDEFFPLRFLRRENRNPLLELLFLAELWWLYRRQKPSLGIHFTIKPSLYGSLVARWNRVPAISVLTGLGYVFLHPGGLNRLVPVLMKTAFRRLQHLVVYNEGDRGELLRRDILQPEQCALVPGEGIDTGYFQPQEAGTGDRPFTFLFIGRLLRDKGIMEYLAASGRVVQECPNTCCQVLGEHKFSNPSAVSGGELQQALQESGVCFFGSALDVRPYLRDCDVVVLPSYREGLSRVILEAMSMGKPVITTDVAGCRDLISHGENGLLVPARQPEALLEAMLQFRFASVKELAAIGAVNRRKVLQRYTVEQCNGAFLALVEEALGQERDRRNVRVK